eukprot:scaffold114485_cov39-Tisochrysis_lutea.AAC.1
MDHKTRALGSIQCKIGVRIILTVSAQRSDVLKNGSGRGGKTEIQDTGHLESSNHKVFPSLKGEALERIVQRLLRFLAFLDRVGRSGAHGART